MNKLVSVITRTQNRPLFLREAVRSVATQTYPNIELIVINDGGPNCEQLVREESTGHIQQFTYKQIEQQSGRSHAANIGLGSCNGEFIIFLDDDDWFLPEHIEKLVRSIESHPDSLVAYTAIQCVDSEKKKLAIQFKTPFNPILLIASNYIPIHAALFSKKLLQLGCRIDESLEVYEDWDFWIQASMLTHFLFVDGFSAIYRISDDSGFGVNADSQMAYNSSLILFNKWLPCLPQDKLSDLMRCVQKNFVNEQLLQNKDQDITNKDLAITHKDQEISNLDVEIIHKDQKISNLDVEITHKDQEISNLNLEISNLNLETSNLNQQINTLSEISHQLQTSTSWRVTKPLRYFGHQVKRIQYIYATTSNILTLGGGFIASANKTLYILRKEGLQGLKHRLASMKHKTTAGITYKNDYEKWVHLYDTLNDDDRARINSRIKKMPNTPLISIIMPLYDPPIEFLDAAIWSVRNQLYSNWELCIADDASKNTKVHELLQHHAKEDERIKIVFRKENGHISKASNSSLDLATGEFVALMDNDDTLSEHALFWVAETINQNPHAALIYSDEDKLSEQDGSRIDPYFKCEWNQELFLGHNLITHLGVYKTSIVKDLGGFRVGFEGAQDYDLAARFIEKIKPEQIHHIPRILYHWRILPGSTAKNIDAKPYAAIASEKALNEHLVRSHIKGHVSSLNFGHRIQFDLPEKPPLVSIIIPTRNGLDYVRTCVTSIFSLTTYPKFEIILVDNGSDDNLCLSYFSQLEEDYSNFRIIRDNSPFNYSALNNLAAKSAKGEVIALLNNDIEVISPDWLEEMVSIALQPGVGAVGAKLLYPDNTLQHAGVILGIGGWAGHAHKGLPASSLGYVARAALMQNFSAVTGACLVISREKFFEVGALNETDLAVACNDVDLCLKLKSKGYRNIWTPFATLYHHESATRGYEDTDEKRNRFMKEVSYMNKEWEDILHNDPAYNPNLTLSHEDFSLSWPPRVDSI